MKKGHPARGGLPVEVGYDELPQLEPPDEQLEPPPDEQLERLLQLELGLVELQRGAGGLSGMERSAAGVSGMAGSGRLSRTGVSSAVGTDVAGSGAVVSVTTGSGSGSAVAYPACTTASGLAR